VRVSYAELPVDPAAIGLTAGQIGAIPWATPTWAEGHQPLAAAAAWVIESGGRRIVVDPAQAVDAILRSGAGAAAHQEAFAARLDAAGCPRESIDTVIASHIDGIGMIAWREDDGWSPFFPNAQVLLSEREYDAIAGDGWYRPSGAEALIALYEQGVVTTVGDDHVVTDDVTIRWTGAHSPGHQVVNISSRGDIATMIGHLALSPLHAVIRECANHIDSEAAVAALMQLRDQGDLLIGPLWPAPGVARWTGTEMQPAG
jgi:glyoxylase-like metal-dependent hydrolase (beta-lactamase superfamily II)